MPFFFWSFAIFLKFWILCSSISLLSISLQLSPLTIFVTHHYHVPLCAYYMRYIRIIGTWLRLFPCNNFESLKIKYKKKTMFSSLAQIFWYSSFWNDSVVVVETGKVTIISITTQQVANLCYWNAAIKCDIAQQKLIFWC